MAQEFEDVTSTDFIDVGIIRLRERDLTAITAMSGDADPLDPPTDALYDNRTQGVLKINGDVIIDYKNKLLNSTMLETMYQPLNSVLTAISGATLTVPCIVNRDGSVIPITAYGVTAANNTTIEGIKALAKLSTVASNRINDASVTQEKLATPISTDPVFKCGDLLYSCRNDTRPGFLKLGKGYTVGGASSNATYRNNAYLNLYTNLWADPNAILRDYSNNIVGKGASANGDFTSGKSIQLPNPRPDVGNTLIETTTPGTYQIYLQPGVYEIFVVTGGGGSVSVGSGGGSATSAQYEAIGGS